MDLQQRASAFSATRDGLVASAPAHRVTLEEDVVHFTLDEGTSDIRVRGPRLALGGTAPEPLSRRALEEGVATRRLGHAVEERVENRADGVAFSWHFSERFDGTAVVTLPLDGYALHQTNGEGLTLRAPGRERGIFVTHAVWIDADERRTEVRAQWREGAIEYQVPDELVARSTFPAVLDPTIGPELGPPPASLRVDAPSDQEYPAVCVGPTSVLVTWSDDRRWGESVASVFAARIDRNGTLLDRVGVPIGRGRLTGTSLHPECVATDDGFVIGWVGVGQLYLRSLPARTGPPRGVETAHGVDVLDLRLAGGGASFGALALTRDASGQERVEFRRFDSLAAPLDPSATALTAGDATGELALAASTAGYWAAWSESSGSDRVVVTALPRAGPLAPSPGVVTTDMVTDLVAASDGTAALIGWSGASGIVGQKVDATGSPVGATAPLTRSTTDQRPDLVFGNGAYRLAWQSGTGGMYVGGLDPAIAPAPATERSIGSSAATAPNLAIGGDETFVAVAYEDEHDAKLGSSIEARRIVDGTESGWSSVPLIISLAEEPTFGAVTAFGMSDSFFLAYRRLGLYPREYAYGNSVAIDGALGPTVTVSGHYTYTRFVTGRPMQIAASDSAFIVAWYDEYVSPDDFKGVSITVPSSGFLYEKELAANTTRAVLLTDPDGTNFDVLFVDGSRTVQQRNVIPSGTAYRPVTVYTASSTIYDFEAMGDLIAWRSWAGTTVTVNRWRGGGTGDHTFSIPSGTVYETTMAKGDTSYLYVWQDGTVGDAHVFVQPLDLDGRPSAPRIDLGYSRQPTVTWSGSEFVVVFRRAGDIWASRIGSDGALLDATPALLTEDVEEQAYDPYVASDGRGRLLVAYTRFVEEAGSAQVRARIVDLAVPGTDPLGTPCENGWSCASGFCADGFCCDGACTGECESCAASLGATADGTCTPAAAGTLCRAAEGACDVAESCDGSSGTCPADGVGAAGTACGAGPEGPCDLADSCNGTDKSCDTTRRLASGTSCRPAAGPCDLEESCDGSSVACPEDGFATALFVCRPSAGVCDIPESCDGTGAACPADEVRPARYTCRIARGSCDVAEYCDGTNVGCPSNGYRAASHRCRPSAGVCDPAEHCTGTDPSCPADEREAAGTICRPSAGPCDQVELCEPTSPECPEDAVAIRGVVCRPATGRCDIAEACDGVSTECSPDRLLVDGIACDDDLMCNGVSTCQAGECVAGEPLLCDEGSVCDERVAACLPEDGGGCGCRTAGPSPREAPLSMLALVALLAWRRRRS